MKRCAECVATSTCDYYGICLEGRIKEEPKPDPPERPNDRPPPYQPGKKKPRWKG